jgi:hypothetical protein
VRSCRTPGSVRGGWVTGIPTTTLLAHLSCLRSNYELLGTSKYRTDSFRPRLHIASLPPIRELADLLYRGVVGFAGCTYVVGFLVVNLHLRRYGVSHSDFIQSEYVFVGAIWVLLVERFVNSLQAVSTYFNVKI